MSMLKIISDRQSTGYEIIKRVTELSGERPSTGSVYPLLKAMQAKGLIAGKKNGGKTTYEITPDGKATLNAHGRLKEYYEQKLTGSISMVKVTFNDPSLISPDASALIEPVFQEVNILLAHKVEPKKICAVLSKSVIQLQKLLDK